MNGPCLKAQLTAKRLRLVMFLAYRERAYAVENLPAADFKRLSTLADRLVAAWNEANALGDPAAEGGPFNRLARAYCEIQKKIEASCP